MVCFDHATGDPARFVSKRERTGRQNRPLRPALQPDKQTFRLDGYGRFDPLQNRQTLLTYFRDTTLGPTPHLDEAKRVAERLTGPYIAQQIKRLQEAAAEDPELAIGTAKEFLESICKTILTERGAPPSKNEDLPALVRATVRSLAIVPSEVSNQVQLEKTVTVLLNNLGSIGHQLAELRNQFGTGHGRSTDHVGLPARHAKLAIGAAATLAVFLYESYEATLR